MREQRDVTVDVSWQECVVNSLPETKTCVCGIYDGENFNPDPPTVTSAPFSLETTLHRFMSFVHHGMLEHKHFIRAWLSETRLRDLVDGNFSYILSFIKVLFESETEQWDRTGSELLRSAGVCNRGLSQAIGNRVAESNKLLLQQTFPNSGVRRWRTDSRDKVQFRVHHTPHHHTTAPLTGLTFYCFLSDKKDTHYDCHTMRVFHCSAR
ncbi:hypothetical protein J6590_062358 [Homalodisca vitripennis]|nr:hypothetical protein J6590_101363 [Homalodisca vitripennis]KAG8256801.1 hypothetical protein J6590_062358 [Homalodisca vitripennis]